MCGVGPTRRPRNRGYFRQVCADSANAPGGRVERSPHRSSELIPARRSVRYAAAWRDEDGTGARGSATLGRDELVLRAVGASGSRASLRVPLRRIARVRIGRSEADRVRGERSVVIELVGGRTLSIAPLGPPGAVFELADLVAERGHGAPANEAR